MKRVFSLLIIFMFLLSSKKIVFGESNDDLVTEVKKDVICVEGNDYSENLQYDGYEIIYNNVNYNLPGRYKIIYQDEDYNEYEKKVDVISKESLNIPYYQIEESKFLLNDFYQESIVCSLALDDYLYVVYSLADRDTDTYDLYLNVFLNNKIIKHHKLNNDVKMKINNILPYNDNIILIGSIYDKQYDYDLYYRIVNKEGDMVDECKIIGNKKEEIIDGVVVNDYIYVLGSTKSNTGYYAGNIDTDIFLFKIDLNVGIVKKAYVSKTELVEYASNMVLIDDHMYFGYSKMEDGFLMHYVRKMNLNFEVVDELLIGGLIDFEFIKFASYNNKIYLLNQDWSSSLNKYISNLFVFNTDLRVVYKKAYTYPIYEKIYATDLVINEEGIISILLKIVDSNNKYGYMLIKEQNKEEILNITQMVDTNILGFVDNRGNRFYKLEGKKVYEVEVNSVIVKRFGNTEIDEFTSIHDYDVIVNSENLSIDLEHSSLDYNLNSFGSYRLIYGFNSKDVLFLYHLDIYVKENINIISKENYDINYTLIFNGIGYLNGEEISTGYVITKEGKYILEVKGNDHAVVYYEFTISNNACKIDYINKDIKVNDILVNTPVNNKLLDIDVYQETNQLVDNKNQNNWMLLIPGIILVTAVILIIKIH